MPQCLPTYVLEFEEIEFRPLSLLFNTLNSTFVEILKTA